ncbi:YbhB/YbcL family Raf kinase inhibitor-like protein [Lacticaseibacillus baoqingensis]|uniref:YbhB/YbcL family Raf kinase inhibitor-like protein n=1 Tax=Lacticaseibacillus baoqingensis TaxID=2486013 RepID=A0ABW4E8E8_9LACO|nr:YbhB/YbcL family Raf kinase inhibitor-like protein [Lacticaseibacillus baoqingensis]
MQISVPVTQGFLADKFGKYAPEADRYQGYPKRSFPITLTDAPAGTQSFALWLIDFDAVPVSGFPWIHWNAANIPGDTTLVPEDASRSGFLTMVQGHNANAGKLAHNPDSLINTGYVGPQPPNADHAYTLTVFALDTLLDLKAGFWLNEARHAMAGHILAQASQDLWSRV